MLRTRELEDYEEAYYSRKDDFNSLRDVERKIMKMHWGGIVIECFVKYIIVQKYCLVKMRKKGEWYSQYGLDRLEELSRERDLSRDDYNRYACKCDGHDFRIWIKDLLNFDISEVTEELDILYNPLGEYNKKFIDLRYETESIIEEVNYNYDDWEKAYIKVSTWLEGYLENIEREDCKTW